MRAWYIGIMNLCDFCHVSTSNSSYCSLQCSNLARGVIAFQLRMKKTRICEYCGYKFGVKHLSAKFCSHSCAASATNTGKIKVNKQCLNCFTRLFENARTFCSTQCASMYHSNIVVLQWKSGELLGYYPNNGCLRGPIRDYILKSRGSVCELCGWGVVNTKTGRIPVHIDHIDGDYTNCQEDNLRILCPNCHSLTSTYGSLNKGSGRPYRKAYYSRI